VSAAAHSFTPPALDGVQQRVVGALQEDGIAVIRFAELFDEALWEELAADISPFVQQAHDLTRDAGPQPEAKDDFLVRRFEGVEVGEAEENGKKGKYVFALDNPWLRVAGSERMLDIVNTYRRQWTRLYYLDNWFTVPFPNSDTAVGSQRWHRDPEEAHVVKVFVYFSDVDEGAGPFEYVRSSSTGGRYGDLWPWGGKVRKPPPDEFDRTIPAEDRLSLTGPAGTMIFCDTGGFHRGGLARTAPRVLSIFSYVSPEEKGRKRFKVDFGGREDTLSPQVRAALD
jgi:hypothetical protein